MTIPAGEWLADLVRISSVFQHRDLTLLTKPRLGQGREKPSLERRLLPDITAWG
jgi:hypothetical protein